MEVCSNVQVSAVFVYADFLLLESEPRTLIYERTTLTKTIWELDTQALTQVLHKILLRCRI